MIWIQGEKQESNHETTYMCQTLKNWLKEEEEEEEEEEMEEKILHL